MIARGAVSLRADARPETGTGHVMRCLTLGAALRAQGGQPTLVTEALPDALADRATALGVAVEVVADAEAAEAELRRRDVPVVVDGYDLGSLVVAVRDTLAVTVVDDNGDLPTAGVRRVVNQNLHADPAWYGTAGPDRELLLGARFAMIRPDVVAVRRQAATSQTATVLVAIGGSDPLGVAGGVVDELLASTDARVWVARGLTAGVGPIGATDDRVVVDRGDLVEGLAIADVAVIGAGTTLWEVGYLGLPSVAVVVADNQLLGSAAAQAAGLVDRVDAREPGATPGRRAAELLADGDARARMSAAGRALFDGRGAARIAQAVLADAD